MRPRHVGVLRTNAQQTASGYIISLVGMDLLQIDDRFYMRKNFEYNYYDVHIRPAVKVVCSANRQTAEISQ